MAYASLLRAAAAVTDTFLNSSRVLTVQMPYALSFPSASVVNSAQLHFIQQLDGCIVWNAHNTVLGEEALVIYIVPVCYVKTGRYGKS